MGKHSEKPELRPLAGLPRFASWLSQDGCWEKGEQRQREEVEGEGKNSSVTGRSLCTPANLQQVVKSVDVASEASHIALSHC